MPTKAFIYFIFLFYLNSLVIAQNETKPYNAGLFFYPQFLLQNGIKAEVTSTGITGLGLITSFTLYNGITNTNGQYNVNQLTSTVLLNNPLRNKDKFKGFGFSIGSTIILGTNYQEETYLRHSIGFELGNTDLIFNYYEFDYTNVIRDGLNYVEYDLFKHKGKINQTGLSLFYLLDTRYENLLINTKIGIGYKYASISNNLKKHRNYSNLDNLINFGYTGLFPVLQVSLGYMLN
ncbi:MAG: hypothetical protein ACK4K9_06790 [Bacteroidia bacterium]